MCQINPSFLLKDQIASKLTTTLQLLPYSTTKLTCARNWKFLSYPLLFYSDKMALKFLESIFITILHGYDIDCKKLSVDFLYM